MYRHGNCFSNATLNDWEDIAVGPCEAGGQRSCIYILDDGDRDGQAERTIYKIPEPESLMDGQTLNLEDVLVYR